MIFKIRIADTVIEIHSLYDEIYKHCFEYITDDEDITITVKTTLEDIDFEKDKALKGLTSNEENPSLFPDSFLEINAVHRKICSELIHHNILLLHGSAVAVDGKAYIFIAPSGTGKTTHTNLWLKNIKGSFIVNGDKPLLKVRDHKIAVYGTPWCGKEKMQTNTCVDLQAIIVLDRSDNNEISEISFKQAFSPILAQSYRSTDKNYILKTVEIITQLSQNVRFYHIRCNMQDEASLLAYKYMNNLPI